MAATDTAGSEPVLAQACVSAVPRLPADRAEAWVGFLAAHAEITRRLDAELNARFDLSLSALEVLARLAWAEHGRLRMSTVAETALLSQSRVSRLVDSLEHRGLVERASCPSDSRGVYASISDAGRELAGRALRWHWEHVDELFFSSLSTAQVSQLGEAWRAILGRSVAAGAGDCPAA
jgi:DNA-binding MarR family transcriptional regulator